MIRKGFRTALLILSCTVLQTLSFAQIKFEGTISSLPPSGAKLILEYFSEDSWKHLISKELDATGNFTLNVTIGNSGQYRVRLGSDPERWGDFMLNAKQLPAQGLTLRCDYKELRKQPIRVEPSKEHDAYALISPAYNKLSLNPDSLDRKGLAFLTREREFFELCDRVKREFPETITAKMVCDLLGAPITPEWKNATPQLDSIRSFNAAHAFDRIPFTNPDIVHHIGFIRRLNLLFDYYQSQNRVVDYIDKLMARALLDDHISAFAFRFLLEKMIDYKNEEGLSYLITWYSQDCSENTLVAQETKNLLLALEHCKPGNSIEFLTLPDPTGKRISMKEVASKSKITLILFWKTSCSHCREFEPLLQELYAKYHTQGLEVYAIATDKVEDVWRGEMKAMPADWPSVFLEYAARKDFSKRFPVPSTPTIIAIDQNGKILRRLVQRSKIESIILEMFEEIK
jgi:thiol-disulfide isomerase/thioredoxin